MSYENVCKYLKFITRVTVKENIVRIPASLTDNFKMPKAPPSK